MWASSSTKKRKRDGAPGVSLDESTHDVPPSGDPPVSVPLSSVSLTSGMVSASGEAVLTEKEKESRKGPRVIPLKRNDAAARSSLLLKAIEKKMEREMETEKEKEMEMGMGMGMGMDGKSSKACGNSETATMKLGAGVDISDTANTRDGVIKNGTNSTDNDMIEGLDDFADEDETAYEHVPVEGFGDALLRGMNWEPGKAFGRSDAPVEPYLIESRPARLGLGASAEERKRLDEEKYGGKKGNIISSSSSYNNNSSSSSSSSNSSSDSNSNIIRSGASSANTANGNNDNSNSGSTGKRGDYQSSILDLGEDVIVSGDGEHTGREGVVRALLGDVVAVAFSVDNTTTGRGEEVDKIPLVYVQRRAKRRVTADTSTNDNNGGDRKSKRSRREREEERRKERERRKAERRAEREKRRERKGWLACGLRVRIVSRSFENGSYYLKKGTIIDVPAVGQCSVRVDGAQGIASGVRESQLETVIARDPNTRVIILVGKLKGEKGVVRERNSRAGTASVQMDSDLSLQTFDLDDICGFESMELSNF